MVPITLLQKIQQPKNGEYFTEEDYSQTILPDGGYTYTTQPGEAYGRSKVCDGALNAYILCNSNASALAVTTNISFLVGRCG